MINKDIKVEYLNQSVANYKYCKKSFAISKIFKSEKFKKIIFQQIENIEFNSYKINLVNTGADVFYEL